MMRLDAQVLIADIDTYSSNVMAVLPLHRVGEQSRDGACPLLLLVAACCSASLSILVVVDFCDSNMLVNEFGKGQNIGN